VDGRSDLYSLGVTLFQMLTGSLPLKGDSMAALMYQIANQPAPSVRSLRPELPQVLADVLARTLAKSPADRYQSGAELAAQLRRCAPGGAATAALNVSADTGNSQFEATQALPRDTENALVATQVTLRPDTPSRS
jgi:eukaryotic-like serine/threonine-protein kinase